MSASQPRVAFDGTFNRMDFIFAESLLTLQNPGSLEDLKNIVQAIGPGSLYVLPALFSGAYSVVIYIVPGNCNVVSILGTQNGYQLLAEMALSNLVQYDGIPGNVSTYFSFDLTVITLAIKETINQSLPTVFVGHSLGGASAELLASQFLNVYNLPVRAVYTLGAPKPGDASFAAQLTCPVIRLENAGDLVPSVPQVGLIDRLTQFGIFPLAGWADYVHPGQAYTLNDDGSIVEGHTEMSALSIIGAILTGNTDIHYLSSYDARLKKGVPQAGDLVCGSNGYEKPWKLFGLQEQAPPALATGNVSLTAKPIRKDAFIPIAQIDRLGTVIPLGEVFDAAPVSYTPQLNAVPTADPSCCS